MSRYIYFVGKPYLHPEALDAARAQGCKIGVFLDKDVRLRNPNRYDRIIEVDFSSPQAMIASIADKKLVVDGLVCTYENYIVAKSRLAEYFKVEAPSVGSSEMCTDKYLMRQAFLEANPAITPNFGLAASEKDALELAKKFSYPLILKPTNLVKSLLVLRCNDQAELLRNFAYAQDRIAGLYKKYRIYDRAPQLIIEEYIEGKTCSIAAFVDKNGRPHFCQGIVSLVSAQDVGNDDNYIYGRFLPAKLEKDLAAKLFETARQGIAALKMTSAPAHVELIYRDKEVKIIEIGARIGGYRPRMYGASYGVDLIAQEVKLALGQTPDLGGDFLAYCAVYELFPETEGKFTGIRGMTDVSDFAYYAVKAKRSDLVGPAKKGYKAAAIIIVSHSNKTKFSRICKTVDKLKVNIK
jgi:biotin carboxylase